MDEALIVTFALDDLRRRHGARVPAGADPRHDASPFRAFRAALLAAAARCATGEARLSMWWEGTYNGYALAVAAEPADALPGLERAAAAACEVDASRVAAPRAARYPLALVAPGRAAIAREADGAAWEAPFGAATGHFGAPGMRRAP
jgi:hypothetical protein